MGNQVSNDDPFRNVLLTFKPLQQIQQQQQQQQEEEEEENNGSSKKAGESAVLSAVQLLSFAQQPLRQDETQQPPLQHLPQFESVGVAKMKEARKELQENGIISDVSDSLSFSDSENMEEEEEEEREEEEEIPGVCPRDLSPQNLFTSTTTTNKDNNRKENNAPPDGFKWRKYGQKIAKGTKRSRSYYRCLHPNCPAKKIILKDISELVNDGKLIDISYRGIHNHSPNKITTISAQDQESFLKVFSNHSTPQSTITNQQSIPNQVPISTTTTTTTTTATNSPPMFPQTITTAISQIGDITNSGVDKIVVNASVSKVNSFDDGYGWRKYGQKYVRGNQFPKSYYRCTYSGCNVRKQVERVGDSAVTTYNGSHNHPPPGPKKDKEKS